jgi:hypothetical protein
MMVRERSGVLRTIAAVVCFVGVSSAAMSSRSAVAAVPGMTFRLKVTLRDVSSSGRTRTQTMYGRGAFGAGHGRVDIDSVEGAGPIRKGDFFIIQDTLHTLWARPADMRVRRLDAPLVNPLEGISEKLAGSAGLPSDLKVSFDTVSLNETVNNLPARHFRITADATYPMGNRQIQQKVVVEQWLATIPVKITNPFGSRIRGLPDLPTSNGDYRAFLNTLAAANRVFGEAVTLRTLTTTSWNYGGGMGQDYFQTVEILDLKHGDIDEKLFVLPDAYRRKPPPPPAR